jgi:hypothetical protein
MMSRMLVTAPDSAAGTRFSRDERPETDHDGGFPRAEAELLAWRELENRWNLAHGERVSRELCAGCRRPIGTEAALDLIDGKACTTAPGMTASSAMASAGVA